MRAARQTFHWVVYAEVWLAARRGAAEAFELDRRRFAAVASARPRDLTRAPVGWPPLACCTAAQLGEAGCFDCPVALGPSDAGWYCHVRALYWRSARVYARWEQAGLRPGEELRDPKGACRSLVRALRATPLEEA
jgi:hypothetical protein